MSKWERRDAKRQQRQKMKIDGRSTKSQRLERYWKKKEERVRSKERRALVRGEETWDD